MKYNIYAILVCILISCKSGFYDDAGGFSHMKIPICQPCYVGNTSTIDGPWYLSNCNYGIGNTQVTEINVIDSILITRYYDDYIAKNKRDTLWGIYLFKNQEWYKTKSRLAFEKKASIYTRKKIVFYKIQDVRMKQVNEGRLEWFPR